MSQTEGWGWGHSLMVDTDRGWGVGALSNGWHRQRGVGVGWSLSLSLSSWGLSHHVSCCGTTPLRMWTRQRTSSSRGRETPHEQTGRNIYCRSVRSSVFPCHQSHHPQMSPRSNSHLPSGASPVLAQRKIKIVSISVQPHQKHNHWRKKRNVSIKLL